MDFEITIDGQTTGVKKGETIIEVAYRLGIEVPVFCWHPKIDPIGGCRMCLVEVERMPKLVVACATPAAPNMVVMTHNEKVDKARKGVIEFMLIDHPLDCPTCDKAGECGLQDNVYKYGLDRSRFTETKNRYERDQESLLDDTTIGPQVIRNMNRCIRCFRCTRFTQEIAGEGDLGIFNRGWATEIDTLPDREIGNLFSGNTVEICPVGALMSVDFRYKARPWLSYRTPSICNLCSDGCNLKLWSNRSDLFRVTSRQNDEVDEGWICDRGRYAYAYRESKARIISPKSGDGSTWTDISWDQATTGAAAALQKVAQDHGPGAIGGLVSPTTSNESIYLFQRFFRTVLSSNSVDWRVDRKHLASPDRRRRNRAFPRQARSLTRLDTTKLILVVGCDLENERPITSLRVLKAQRTAGARIVLLNNRPTRLRRKADQEWIYAPGSEHLLWTGLLKLVAQKKSDQELPEELKSALASVSMERVARGTGIPPEQLTSLVDWMIESPSTLIILGRDIRQSESQENIVDLALAAGELLGLDGGERGAVELSPEYANAIGATYMGGEPEVLPGGIDAHDTKHAAHLAELWGASLPAAGGYDAAEMLEAAHNDRLKAIVLLDINPLFHFPDIRWVESAFAKLDCVIALGKFDLGRTGFANYFLPTASVQEDPGTFLSGEGRLQYFEAAVRHRGQARPVREILSDLARQMGKAWDFPSAQSVFVEMGKAIPLLADTSHVRLRESSGVVIDLGQYSQDTETTFSSAAKALEVSEKPPATAATEGSFILQTGNMGHHFGHLTHQSEAIMTFASVPYAMLHPDDCETLGVESGTWLNVSNPRGEIQVTARPSPLVSPGMIVIPVHYPQANPNVLCDRAEAADFVIVKRIEESDRKREPSSVAVNEVGAWTH